MAGERRVPPDLSPASVARRLEVLRRIAVLERDDDARARLTREQPAPSEEPFAAAVARRLDELRALCALADYLHGAGLAARPPASPRP